MNADESLLRARGRLLHVADTCIRALQVLRSTFGHTSFRDGQADVVTAVATGRDVLAVLPTGAGKSICYQVPALLNSGPTLVVSPLIALMQDQVSILQRRGVSAAAITSASTATDRSAAAAILEADQTSLVYVAPERLASPSFRRLVSPARLSRIVVDEAHCISEWGHDFRPDYREIGAFADSVGRPPIAAFTATATPATRADIEHQLSLQRPVRFIESVDRPNLRWAVIRHSGAGESFRHISQEVTTRGGPGLRADEGLSCRCGVCPSPRRTGSRSVPRRTSTCSPGACTNKFHFRASWRGRRDLCIRHGNRSSQGTSGCSPGYAWSAGGVCSGGRSSWARRPSRSLPSCRSAPGCGLAPESVACTGAA